LGVPNAREKSRNFRFEVSRAGRQPLNTFAISPVAVEKIVTRSLMFRLARARERQMRRDLQPWPAAIAVIVSI
jgi:hypothetical protein